MPCAVGASSLNGAGTRLRSKQARGMTGAFVFGEDHVSHRLQADIDPGPM